MSHPALQRLGELIMVSTIHINKRRRARSAVEKLITTTHSKVHIPLIQTQREYASTVSQIPDHQDISLMRHLSERGYIMHCSIAEVDVTEHQYGNLIAQGIGKLLSRHHLQSTA